MARVVALAIAFWPVIASGTASLAPGGESSWPRPIPCRTQADADDDVFVMTLGDVTTNLADGVFDPTQDEVHLKDGATIAHYYRDKLGVKYFQPIDKSRFPLPPTGWCTWYYYYPRINA